MKYLNHFLLILALIAIVMTGPVNASYYDFSSTPPDTETTSTPQAPVPAYVMPSEPISETISSASTLLLYTAIGSTQPSFCVLTASDNIYLNGSVATPTDGIFLAKDTAHFLPLGSAVSVVTSSDTVTLKILPVK